MIVGMDFGTTNSGMAVYNGRSVNLLNIDPQNNNPTVARTAIYITNDHAVHIGRSAVDHYFEHNVGRAVKLRKVWVGEIEVYAEDLYYVTDAYVYVDVLSPGRLFLSIKSGLRSEDFPGTVIGQHYYSLENLISTFFTTTKIRAEKELNQSINQIVLGRPVRFAFDEEKDRLAQGRLLRAAFQAGYEKVYFQYEPIAAAYNYETMLDKPENVLVFDFGGGTLDVTVMRLGDPKNRGVLATGGIPIAGDVFDQKLVRHKLARHFGEGSPYGPRHKNLTVPGWIYDTFSNWQTILELQSSERKQMLKEIAQTARRRYQIEALVSVVANNYGLRMFDVVEQSKRQLSDKRGAEILFEGPDFSVRDFVTRREFENIIRQEIIAIDEHLDEMLVQSGLTAEKIDTVIRTGGSAQIPAFVQILEKKFGAQKVRSIDTFSSVTAGLGVVALRVEEGEIELKGYTPDDIASPTDSSNHANQPNVTPINLDMIQRRILSAEGDESIEQVEEMVLMILNESGLVTAVPIHSDALEPGSDYDLSQFGINEPPTQLLVADLDAPILYITSHYRFVLTTGREQLERHRLELTLENLYRMERQEKVIHICRWRDLTETSRMLLITSAGVARPFPINVMRESIEAPTPLKFDHALDGIVVAALGVERNQTMVLFSKVGRSVRFPIQSLRTSGTQAFNCGKTDRVVAGLTIDEDIPIMIGTADGNGRLVSPEWIPVPQKTNTKGKSMIAKKSPLVLATNHKTGWFITDQRLVWLENGRFRHEDTSKSESLLKLQKDEQLIGFLENQPI